MMSSSEGVSIDQNGLSSQNRRPVGLVGGSNDEQPSSNVGAKSTRSRRRNRKPSQKALDANESAAISNADRIKRVNPRQQKDNTDFDDIQSINKNFPPHVGKGQSDVPRWWLAGYHSNDAKAKRVREWRMFTDKQQRQKISEHWRDAATTATTALSRATRVSTESVVDEATRKEAAKERKRSKKIRVPIDKLTEKVASEVTFNDGVHFSATNIEYSETCLSDHLAREYDAFDMCIIAFEEKEEKSAQKRRARADRRNTKRRNNRAQQREQRAVSIVLVSFVYSINIINFCSRMFLSVVHLRSTCQWRRCCSCIRFGPCYAV